MGIILTAVGLMGFFPSLAPEVGGNSQQLFNIFRVNYFQSFWQLVSGVAAISAATTHKEYYQKIYAKYFGGIYAGLAGWGAPALGGDNYDSVLFGLIHVNAATEMLNIAVGSLLIYLGFFTKRAS